MLALRLSRTAGRACSVPARAFTSSVLRLQKADAKPDLIQALFLDELKKYNEESKKKTPIEEEVLALIQQRRVARAKELSEQEAAQAKAVEALKKKVEELAAKKTVEVAAAKETAEEKAGRVALLAKFGLPESATLKVTSAALLKKFAERAAISIAQTPKDASAEGKAPNADELAVELRKLGIPQGADFFVASELIKKDWQSSALAVAADRLLKSPVTDRDAKLSAVFHELIKEHTDEEKELLKAVSRAEKRAVEYERAKKEAQVEHHLALAKAKEELILASFGLTSDDGDVASAVAKLVKKS